MGDWAKGEFIAAGQTAGRDYDCTVLGDHGVPYVMGGDVFAFPKNPKAVAAQALMAKTMIDPVTQIEFAKKKGSIPVRLDLDVSGLDVCAPRPDRNRLRRARPPLAPDPRRLRRRRRRPLLRTAPR